CDCGLRQRRDSAPASSAKAAGVAPLTSPRRVPRGVLDVARGDLAGWDARLPAGIRAEETPRWRRNRVRGGGEGGWRRKRRQCARPGGGLPRPEFQSSPRPQAPGAAYLEREGRGGARRAGHGRAAGARGCGGRRRHAAQRSVPRPGAARQGQTQGTAQPLQHPWGRSLQQVWSPSVRSRENQSHGPCQPLSCGGPGLRPACERLASAGASLASSLA
ncbi:uncharacterized protein WCI35_014573, partial [Daubentonia madagascariensis]